jgi:hypothetical protein
MSKRACRQYAIEERNHLVAKVERLREGGHGLLAACKQVGISDKSYHLWRKAISMRAVEVTALVPVSVTGLSFAPPKAVIESLALLAVRTSRGRVARIGKIPSGPWRRGDAGFRVLVGPFRSPESADRGRRRAGA